MSTEEEEIDDSLPTARGEPLTDIGRQLSNVPAWSSYLGEFYADRQKALNEQGKKTEITLQFFKIDQEGLPIFDDDGIAAIESTKTFRRRPLTLRQVQTIEEMRARVNKAVPGSKTASDTMIKLYEKLGLWVFGINNDQLKRCDFKELAFDLDAIFTNIVSGVPPQAGSFTT